ncbi:MAG: Smr/MutS family protein [Gemmatimonadales bacterium]
MLRRLSLEEAEAKLHRALDEAVLADRAYLRVIHGKGTGAIRRLVQTVLRRDPRVKQFTTAPAHQGGSGATLVEFVP